jgi:hypothetical protein
MTKRGAFVRMAIMVGASIAIAWVCFASAQLAGLLWLLAQP